MSKKPVAPGNMRCLALIAHNNMKSTQRIIQGATKKHARLRPFPFLCEILIQFHEKIIKFDQIFVKQKIRVQGLAFWTRFVSVDQKSGFGSNDTIFVFFIGFLSLFHQNYVFFVKFLSMFIIRWGLGFSFFELLISGFSFSELNFGLH